MSNTGEDGPSPEQEPIILSPAKYKCPNCDRNIASKYSNTLYAKYLKQPWMDHVRVMCPNDGFTGIYWKESFDEDWAKQFMEHDEEFCDAPGILEARRTSLEIEDVASHEISRRAEDMVAKWGEFLQHITVDIGDFDGKES